jgi:phospholipid/cholesterol/gamma-HCH transport system substrate-binding protein
MTSVEECRDEHPGEGTPMNGRGSKRELYVGAIVALGIAAFLGMLVLAGGGPGFLGTSRTIDVVFRDGQGIREGSSVRVAGIDSGRVSDIDLVEVEGQLRARVRISIPAHLAAKLKQDARIVIQASITGSSRVNIVSAGQSSVSLVPGQLVQGIESTFFDPILQQVGLGPVERSHLSHTIGEIRKSVDIAGPRVREILGSLQETAGGIRESADALRPAVESTVKNIETLSGRVSAATPRIESTLDRLESVTTQADSMLKENRGNFLGTLADVRDLTATYKDITAKNRGKVEKLLDGIELTRARADRVLYQTDILTGHGVQIITKNRADLERTITNVRDATDWADKLVQKIYANPFVLSPFYKPTPEDTRVSTVYDTAQVFTKGAEELNDTVKTLEAMRARAQTPVQQQEIGQLERNIVAVTERLNQTSQLLAEALKRPTQPVRPRRGAN